LRGFHRWFLHTYAFPSCLPNPARLAVPNRHGVDGAASHPHLRHQDQAAPCFNDLLRQAESGSFHPTRSVGASWRTGGSRGAPALLRTASAAARDRLRVAPGRLGRLVVHRRRHRLTHRRWPSSIPGWRSPNDDLASLTSNYTGGRPSSPLVVRPTGRIFYRVFVRPAALSTQRVPTHKGAQPARRRCRGW